MTLTSISCIEQRLNFAWTQQFDIRASAWPSGKVRGCMVLCLPYKFYRPDLCASARQSRLRMLLPKRDWKHKWMLLFVLSLTLTHRQILTCLEDALTSPFDRIHIQGPGISIKLAQSPDTRIHSHRHRIESSAHRQSHPKLGSTASWAQDRVFSTQSSIHSLQHTGKVTLN